MPSLCEYCRVPIVGRPVHGRARANSPAVGYCCQGCLRIGESKPSGKPGLDGFTIRLGVGLLVAAQSMIFGLAINLEEHTPSAMKLAVQGTILGGTLLVVALLGAPLFRGAFVELRRGRLTIEALFLLTMTGAMCASLQSFISGRGPIYFEVVTILLVVYSLGKMIGARCRAAAMAAASGWAATLDTCRLADGRVVDVKTVVPGDLVEVRAGETMAIDGVIREGIGFVSEAPVSGEPFAIVKRPGDRVLAGTISHDALLHIEATTCGTARQIDRLLAAVEAARNRPTTLQAQADRLGRIFFPLIVVTAFLTFAVWTQLAGWRTGLFNAMSVLLVACPCALGLATPIVLWSALSRLAERGLVVHSGDAIERLAQVDRVVFDKTGTLTDERFSLIDIATLAEGNERTRVLSWLALVEARSNHPIAKPFALMSRMNETARIIAHRTIPGCGIEAELEDSGIIHRLRVGRPEWLGSAESDHAEVLIGRLRADHGRRIDVEIDGKIAAIAMLSERLRDSAAEALATLRNMGLPIAVLTGDVPQRASALGLNNAEGNLLPDDKRQRIERMIHSGGKPLMIGDGINDASALAGAHAGIALASGTDLANSAALATLHHADLRVIHWAIAVSRQATLAVRRNLVRAAGYNLIGIALAACGILHPIAAALLMVVSSLWVVWSSARVGMSVEPCACAPIRERDGAGIRAFVHALAFAGQAVCLALLIDFGTSALAVIAAAFVLATVASAYWWYRSPNLPHWLDMTYGMLTLGNLGMLLGWWADNGFTRLHDVGCCDCVQSMRDGLFQPWMWIGMLAGANAAMLFLWRRPLAEMPCRIAMLTGGNIGMIVGMVVGGSATRLFALESVASAALLSFGGMTVGMIGGMLLGSAMVIPVLAPRAPGWQLGWAARRHESRDLPS